MTTVGVVLIAVAAFGLAVSAAARFLRRRLERRLLALLTEGPRTGFDLCVELNLAPHETFALLGHLQHHGLVASEALPRFREQRHTDRAFHRTWRAE